MSGLSNISALHPAGPQAAHIDWLWNVMLWTCAAVYLIVMSMLLGGAWRRRRETEPTSTNNATIEQYVLGGTIVTTVILFGLLIASVIVGKATSDLNIANSITVQVTGYQWWWRFEYEDANPSRRVVTANELHVPVGRPVQLGLNAADVIHSFWAPNLHGKRDLIPGQRTSLTLRADKPGQYRGQCAEFCGLQHAHMAFVVIAEPEDRFQAWYANQLKPAAAPATQETSRGQQVFMSHSCPVCHSVRGTDAGGRNGPDLTHLKSRQTIAALTLPNHRGQLGGWITNPQNIKPGVRMPPNPLAPAELGPLLGYLESLQ